MSTADVGDLLNAKFKLDTRQFETPLKSVVDLLTRFKSQLDTLAKSQQQGGLGAIAKYVAAIGELSKKSFGTDAPQAVGKFRMSLNELASALGAVRKQVQAVGDETNRTATKFNASFRGMAAAANQTATATARAGEAMRRNMHEASHAAESAGRDMVFVGQASEQMSNQIVVAAGRASMAVAQMAMTVQRARTMISGTGMTVHGGGSGGGGAMTQTFGVHATGFTPNQPVRGLLTGPSYPFNHGTSGGAGGFPGINPASYASGMRAGGFGFGGMGRGFQGLVGGGLNLAGGMMGMNVSPLVGGIASAYHAASQAASAFGSVAQRAMSIASSGAHSLANGVAATTAAMGLLTVAGLKFGATYEQSMARVKAITQATDGEFAELDKTAKQLGIDTVYSAKDAADGMSFLAQGGYKVNQIIGAMPSVLNLAAVAQVDVGQASRTLVNIMESMRLHLDELPHSIDVLARALTMGGNDMTEFSYAFRYVGPAAKAANISLEEVAATIQLLGKQGISGSMAGTSLRGIITHLATEGKNLKKQFDALGVKVYDDAGQLRKLPDIIDELNKGLAKSGREGEALKVVMQTMEQRAGTSFQALLTLQGDAIRNATKQLENSAGYAEKVAETQLSTMGNRFKQVIETISTYGITLATHASKPLQELFLKANDYLSKNKDYIESKLIGAWDKFVEILIATKNAFMEVYKVAAPVASELYNEAKGLYQSFMQWFLSLPEGTQNALKVAAAMTALGVGLEKVGGMLPFVGQFASAMGGLLNPLKAVQGAFGLLMPIIGAGGSLVAAFLGLIAPAGPLMLLIGLLGGAAGLSAILNADEKSLSGLAETLKGSFSDAFSAAKESAAAFTEYMNGDALSAIGHVHKAIGDLANAVGMDGLAKELRSLGESEIMNSKGDQARHAQNEQTYGSTGAGILKARADAQKNAEKERNKLRDMKASREGAITGNSRILQFLGLQATDEQFAAQQRRVAEANRLESEASRRAMAFEKDKYAQHDSREADYQSGKLKRPLSPHDQDLVDTVQREQGEEARRKAGVGKDFYEMVAKDQEKARLEYDQQNPNQVVQADKAVKNATGGPTDNAGNPITPGKPGEFFKPGTSPEFKASGTPQIKKSMSDMLGQMLSGSAANVKTAMQNQRGANQTMLSLARESTGGSMNASQQQGYQSLVSLGNQIMQEMNKVASLEGNARQQQIQKVQQLTQLLNKLSGAVSDGSKKLEDMSGEVQKATKDIGALDEKEQEKLAHANGQLSQQEQTVQHAQQQFAQQVGNWFQQQGQQVFDQAKQTAQESGQAMMQQAMGGPGQVQDMIDQAAATGNMKDAIALIRKRAEAQLEQSKLNLHALAINLDPNAGGFGGMPGVTNESYLMTLDIPIVQTIKYLQGLLSKLPKMATGGIVTGPTSIIAGEAGPEAVLPLNNFWNMMGSLPVFQNIQNAMESLGNWFSQGGTVGFGNMWGGNNPALAAQYFANLAKIQHTYEYGMDRLYNSRSINLTPASMVHPAAYGNPWALGARAAYGPGGLPFGAGGYAGPMQPYSGNMMTGMGSLVGAMHLNFNGADISVPGAAQRFAQQLLPALDAAVRQNGYMMGGRGVFKVPGASARTVAYPR